MEARQDQCPRRVAERGKGFTLGGLDWGSTPSASPAQSSREVCLTLGPGPMPSEAHSRLRGSWGQRRETGRRSGEAGRRRPPGPEERERSTGRWPHPLEPGKPTELPGGVPSALRPEAGSTPGPLLFH